MESTTHPADLITPNDAAKIAKVTPATIRRWIAGGKLPGWRVESRWWVSRADVQAMLVQFVPPTGRPLTMSERRAKDAETDRVLREAGVRR